MSWPIVTLGEVAEHCLGKMLDKEKNKGELQHYLANPNVQWHQFKLNNLKTMRFEVHEEERYSLKDGDVVICEGGEAGRCAIWRGQVPGMKIQKALHRVRVGPHLHPEYLARKLELDFFNGVLGDYYTGITIKHLTGKNLSRYSFPLPPLEEQKRIAGILDQADALRRLRTRALDKLNILGQAIFHEMFGDPAVDADRWETAPLSDFSVAKDDIRCGPFGTQLLKSEFLEKGVPLWGIKQVNKHFRIPTHEFVSEEKFEELENYSILPDDIVMTRKGTIGNCAVYPANYPVGVMHSDLLRLRINTERHTASFVADQLRFNRSFGHQLKLISGGAIMAGINVSRLKALHAIAPPRNMQLEYSRRIKAVEAKRKLIVASQNVQQSLFTSLQHRAFRGKL